MWWDITAIKQLENDTDQHIILHNVEDQKSVKCKPHSNVSCDMWIPWCDYQKSFERGHHMKVLWSFPLVSPKNYIPPQPFAWIWQQGDFVRFSTDGKWKFNGDPIPGTSKKGGDRALMVSPTAPHVSLRS